MDNQENRNVSVIKDAEGKKIVMINDIRFKVKKAVNWSDVEEYLRQYVGEFYTIAESKDVVYIGSDLPSEYQGSKYTRSLKGAAAKANELIIKTIKENINNPIGFYLFKRYNYILSPKIQLEIISKMPVSWRKNSIIEDIKTELDLLPQDSTSINIIE